MFIPILRIIDRDVKMSVKINDRLNLPGFLWVEFKII